MRLLLRSGSEKCVLFYYYLRMLLACVSDRRLSL
jgi:WD repeat-containing protein 76